MIVLKGFGANTLVTQGYANTGNIVLNDFIPRVAHLENSGRVVHDSLLMSKAFEIMSVPRAVLSSSINKVCHRVGVQKAVNTTSRQRTIHDEAVRKTVVSNALKSRAVTEELDQKVCHESGAGRVINNNRRSKAVHK
ncbi:MAG: hypothetical protein V3T30_08860 [Thermodesulfobacteriota bacterium]